MEESSAKLISIIVPAIARSVELDRCINSILCAITEKSLAEVIIVFPKSQTVQMDDLGGIVRLIPESSIGIYSAMNDGIRVSRGKYLYFMGIDDIVLDGFSSIVDYLIQTEVRALFFDVYWGSSGIMKNRPNRFAVLLRNRCHQGIVYSRAVFLQYGPYFARFKVQADHFLNLMLLWGEKREIFYLPIVGAYYSGAGFSSRNKDLLFWKLYPLILKRNVGCLACFSVLAFRKLRKLFR